MGGKSSTSTSQVTIPPEVLARYNSVNAQAQQVAQKPFQVYSTDPNAFVAPLTATQNAGIAGTNAAAGEAQPYFQAATPFALAGSEAVNPTPLTASQISQYENPYLNTVLGSTASLLNQNNQQQMSGELGDIINQGAFGGDRAGLAAANLEQQQNLANANIYSGIASNAYNTALATAQQQQGVGLGAAQANRAALQQTAENLAGLGSGAQTAALQGAQAQLGAGAQQQQTEQAGLSALYNQFLQQQSYPFQVAQFLANIAEGTGALSGSTTTTTQPQSIFSDRRLKEDVEPVGETYDGQKIVAFRYKDGGPKQLGLIAQDVEKHHPEAVGLAAGYKTVDYDKATKDAAGLGRVGANDNARKHRMYGGGFADPEEAAAMQMMAGAYGQGRYGPYASEGFYGSPGGLLPRGGSSYVPAANLPVGHLAVASPPPAQPSALDQAAKVANLATSVDKFASSPTGKDITSRIGGLFHSAPDMYAPTTANDSSLDAAFSAGLSGAKRGGLIGRAHRDVGGATPSDLYPQDGPALDIPDEAPHAQLAVAPPPKSSDSGGLGDILKIAETAAQFAGARRGGRIGRDDGGAVDPIEDLPGADPTTLGLKAGDAIARGLAGALKGINPQTQSGLVGGMTGDNVAAGIAGGSQPVSFPQTDQNEQHVTVPIADQMAQLRAMQARAAAPRPAGGGLAGSRPRLNRAPVAPASSGPSDVDPGAVVMDATANPPYATAGDQTASPTDLDPGLGDPRIHSGGGSGLGGILSGLGGLVGYEGGGHFDMDRLLPILSAIGAAGAAPTVHPGVALAAGLAGYANSAIGIKQREAEIAKTQAEAFSQAQGAIPPALRSAGLQAEPGAGLDPSKTFVGPDGKPWHYVLGADLIGRSAPASSPAAAQGAPTNQGPVSTDYKTGTYMLGPSSATDAYMAKNFGVDPSQPGVANLARMTAMNPALAEQNDADEKAAQARIGDQGAVDTAHRQLVQLATAINSLPKGGSLAVAGRGFEGRQELINVYQTARNLLGLGDDPSATSALDSGQIIAKIKTLTGTAMAHQNDQRAAQIAHALTSVLPGGGQQVGAADDILATMLVQNQQQRDFPQYYNNYVAKYGTAIGVQQAFLRDMSPVYDHEQAALPRMMARGVKGPSAAEILMANPQKAETFERGGKRSDGVDVAGFGDGASRYWR